MKYERLTERDTKGFAVYKRKCNSDSIGENLYIQGMREEEVLNRLAELEDDLESGKIIRLPCKVGDTVYEVFKDHIPPFIKETKIEKIVVTGKGLRLRLSRNSFYETAISSLGKTLFLTREEAEKRLKELQE